MKEEKTGYYFKSENDTQSYYFINFTEINNKQNVIVDVNKIDTSNGVDNYWDYTLLHTSNLTKKQKKNREKSKSAKQSRKINRK